MNTAAAGSASRMIGRATAARWNGHLEHPFGGAGCAKVEFRSKSVSLLKTPTNRSDASGACGPPAAGLTGSSVNCPRISAAPTNATRATDPRVPARSPIGPSVLLAAPPASPGGHRCILTCHKARPDPAVPQAGISPARLRGIAEPHCPRVSPPASPGGQCIMLTYHKARPDPAVPSSSATMPTGVWRNWAFTLLRKPVRQRSVRRPPGEAISVSNQSEPRSLSQRDPR